MRFCSKTLTDGHFDVIIVDQCNESAKDIDALFEAASAAEYAFFVLEIDDSNIDVRATKPRCCASICLRAALHCLKADGRTYRPTRCARGHVSRAMVGNGWERCASALKPRVLVVLLFSDCFADRQALTRMAPSDWLLVLRCSLALPVGQACALANARKLEAPALKAMKERWEPTPPHCTILEDDVR